MTVQTVPDVAALQAEIVRLHKINQALMNRAERNASMQGSDFNLFQTAITLGDKVRHRTSELEAALRENEKITRALRESENQIRHLAFYDALTELANRRLLTDRLGRAQATSKRSGCYGALMFLDLDNFKPLNDLHGHEAGDLLLIEVAHRLNRCVRAVDTVARVGGDEFVVLVGELSADQELSLTQASEIAEKIRDALAEPYFLKRDFCPLPGTGQTPTGTQDVVEHRCTACIGVALFANNSASQEEVLKSADRAMYQSKKNGRNQICVAANG
jgi:diguanylate cyclase (GGDEF)-like protein